jgi:opacity protein-like surface antigen
VTPFRHFVDEQARHPISTHQENRSMNKFHLLGTALLVATGAASAQTEFGIALGARSPYSLSCSSGTPCDRSAGSSGKVFIDSLLTPSFGLGAMAWRTGQAQGSFQTPNGLLAGRGRSNGLAVTAYVPLTLDNFTFKARLGLAHSRGQVDYSGGGSASKSSWQPVIGAGASYALNGNWSVNADWDRLPTRFSNSQKSSLNLFSLGVAYKF